MARTTLTIAPGISLPLDAVTQTFAIMAIRGVGKTHTASVMAEEMLKAGQPICVYDPTGAWFGLKTSADGKRPGFPVVIFGGEHADVPLEESAGSLIARVIVEKRISAILDVSLLRKGSRIRFMTDFCEELYHRNREPLHLFLDEAHTVAPQNLKSMPEAARLVGALEDIVLQGRRRGLGITAITQRPALLNTNIRTQCGTLIVLRIIGPHDRKAIEEWIDAHATAAESAEVLKSLAVLKQGEGWVWSPAWLNILERVKFRQRETFDSSATPKVGEKIVAPQAVASVDLDALGEQIKATVEKVKADDPRELRRRIAELEKISRTTPVVDQGAIESAVSRVTAEHKRFRDGLSRKLLDLGAELGRLDQARERVNIALGDVLKGMETTAMPLTTINRVTNAAPPTQRPDSSARSSAGPGKSLPRAERSIMTVLAQCGPSSKNKVAAYSGYAVSGGGFNNALSALRTKGFINGSDPLVATQEGIDALGSWDRLPSGSDLLSYWQSKLPKAEREIITALAANGRMSKAELASACGYAASGGGFNNALSHLRTLEMIAGSGELDLNEDFAEALR